MSNKRLAAAAVAAVVVIAGLVFVLGGGEDEASPTESVDGAFATEMIPHHEMAIQMAEMAQEQGQHPEITRLADAIVEAQEGEISELEDIHERLFGEPAGSIDFVSLPLSDEDSGMDMDMAMLAGAQPFDRAFIDMMIPHHQGAIRMARIELEDGSDPEAKRLAEQIIAEQSDEIVEMNEWRSDWYGAPSPAGGVPPAGTD
ncbi:DUF305 domain-containing protein [Thermoleophilia bacterium SCSIO 60948]|nr:DUF305 domain-containing protein [Thermoleophilia bacterium SCSIO 60948]